MAIRTSLVFLLASFVCSAYSQLLTPIGRANIEITDRRFQCDRIECPMETERCVVTKEKHPQSDWMLVVSNQCYSQDGTLLKKAEKQQSIDPKVHVKIHLEGRRIYGDRPSVGENDADDDEGDDAFNRAVDELSKDFDLN
ncbi:uncharacterized LOC106083544 precursor [Stomoxys calcitrans]|uniref:Putative 13.7 kDa secreted salivary gland protein n=1 Tax=Stomoxys calcitrans TaxID=35570 RepID=A5WXR7_STOCA|nr:uncharacterized LOC106083544 precursor [Stomoxys calcitrans]AAY34545.1 putative 13.7 kDa secreted salivary gland protein [Stomoxys calcitrans]